MFADSVLGPVRQWGYLVKDLDEAMATIGTALESLPEFIAAKRPATAEGRKAERRGVRWGGRRRARLSGTPGC